MPKQRPRSPGRFAHRRVGASGGCSGGRGNVLAMGNCCYVAVCSAAQGASAPTGEERGGGISWRPPAYSSFLSVFLSFFHYSQFVFLLFVFALSVTSRLFCVWLPTPVQVIDLTRLVFVITYSVLTGTLNPTHSLSCFTADIGVDP